MKHYLKIKIFLLAVILCTGTSSKAENFLEVSDINDPLYSDDASGNEVVNSLTNDIINNTMNDQQPGAPATVDGQSLTTRDIVTPRFYLKECETYITERISDQLEEKNLSVDQLSFKREGGTKSFSYDTIKHVVIKPKFLLESLDVNEETGKFTAMLKPQTGKFKIEVSGEYDVNQKVPVLARNLSRGAKISQDDIELKPVPKDKISSSSIINVNDIIGKITVRSVSKGLMLSAEDIRNPIEVYKNSTVSARYKTDTIEIKTLAVALEDGSAGNIIRLKNFDSGKVFKAVVQDDGTVLSGTNSDDITASLPENNNINNIN